MELKQVNRGEFIGEIAGIERKAKIFFNSERWQNLVTFLFFVGLAFGFWLMQEVRQQDGLGGDKSPMTHNQLPPR